MSDTSTPTPPNPEQPAPSGVPPVEQPQPPVPDEPPYAPAKEARQTHVALTQEQEQEQEAEQKAELAKTQSHQSTLAQASGPKETRSGSDELAPQASSSTSSSHGRDSVSDNKTKRS